MHCGHAFHHVGTLVFFISRMYSIAYILYKPYGHIANQRFFKNTKKKFLQIISCVANGCYFVSLWMFVFRIYIIKNVIYIKHWLGGHGPVVVFRCWQFSYLVWFFICVVLAFVEFLKHVMMIFLMFGTNHIVIIFVLLSILILYI